MLTSLDLWALTYPSPCPSWVEDVQLIARQRLATRTAALQPLPVQCPAALLQPCFSPADMSTGFSGTLSPGSSLDAAINRNFPRTPPARHMQGLPHNAVAVPAVQWEKYGCGNINRESSHGHFCGGVKDAMSQPSRTDLEALHYEADLAEMLQDLKAAQAAIQEERRRNIEEQHRLAAFFAAKLDVELEARARVHAFEMAALWEENMRLHETLASRDAVRNATCRLAAASPRHFSARSTMASYSGAGSEGVASLPSSAGSSFDEFTHEDLGEPRIERRGFERFLPRLPPTARGTMASYSGAGSEGVASLSSSAASSFDAFTHEDLGELRNERKGFERFLLRLPPTALAPSKRQRPRPPPLELEDC